MGRLIVISIWGMHLFTAYEFNAITDLASYTSSFCRYKGADLNG